MPAFSLVLLEAEAAAIGIAARRRQLWLVIHPRLASSPRMASGRDIPAPRADRLVLHAAADLWGRLGVRPDPSVLGLPVPESLWFGFGKFAPVAQRIAVGKCWRDCPKQCPCKYCDSSFVLRLYPFKWLCFCFCFPF